jgi:CRP-like cAMP-binding protein
MQAFSEGQSLFLEGGPAEFFYLINAGQILLKVYVPGRDSMSIQAVGPGEALGWSWLFPPFQWHFSAMAVEPAETIAFPAKTLRDIAQTNHKFCYELVLRLAAVVTHRLEDVRQRLIYAGQGLN